MSSVKKEYEENKVLFKLEEQRNKNIDLFIDTLKEMQKYPFSLLLSKGENFVNNFPIHLFIDSFRKTFLNGMCSDFSNLKKGFVISEEVENKIFDMFKKYSEERKKEPFMAHATAEEYKPENTEDEIKKDEVKEAEELGKKIEEDIQKEYILEDHKKFVRIHDKFLDFKEKWDKTEMGDTEGRFLISAEFFNWVENIL